eukprot:CAMPEP_0185846978 /NCGR_PEP_ID=MMETSP1354-20130828/2424_1 /TAXON_ID=708628 /ORGANISM="Erythrolobus madagascarensis, Strain CCMP3276" /LENGTH=342 /DNA_ID=CAMNT_0028547213 /DNA_START=56 /DNA_END=1084 /DNA_ORIENTATION=-
MGSVERSELRFEDTEEEQIALELHTTTYTCYIATPSPECGAGTPASFVAWGTSSRTRSKCDFQTTANIILSDATPCSSSMSMSLQTEPGAVQRAGTTAAYSCGSGSAAGLRRAAITQPRSELTTATTSKHETASGTEKLQPFARSAQMSQVTTSSSPSDVHGLSWEAGKEMNSSSSSSAAPEVEVDAEVSVEVEAAGGRRLVQQRTGRNGGHDRRRKNNNLSGYFRTSRRSLDYDAAACLDSGSGLHRRSIDYDGATARRSIVDSRGTQKMMASSARTWRSNLQQRNDCKEQELVRTDAGKQKERRDEQKTPGRKDTRKLKKAVKNGANMMGVLFVGSSHLK